MFRSENSVQLRLLVVLLLFATTVVAAGSTSASAQTAGGPMVTTSDGQCSHRDGLSTPELSKARYAVVCGGAFLEGLATYTCPYQDSGQVGYVCQGPDHTSSPDPDPDPDPGGPTSGGPRVIRANGQCSHRDGLSTPELSKARYAVVCGGAFLEGLATYTCPYQDSGQMGFICEGPDQTGNPDPDPGPDPDPDPGPDPDPDPGGPTSGGPRVIRANGQCSHRDGLSTPELSKARYAVVCGGAFLEGLATYTCPYQDSGQMGFICEGPDQTGNPDPDPGPDPVGPTDYTETPPRATRVRVENSALVWEMPPGPAYTFQITRNGVYGTQIRDDIATWTRRDIAVGAAGNNAITERTTGGTRTFTWPLPTYGGVGPVAGENFKIEAYIPSSGATNAELAAAGASRYGPASRYGTVPPGAGHVVQHIDNFQDTLAGDANYINRPWVGASDSWTLQFGDEFNGRAGTNLYTAAANDTTGTTTSDEGWFFATFPWEPRPGERTDVYPANTRDGLYDTDHARFVNDGGDDRVLEMAIDNTGYSYIAAGTGDQRGERIDASNGVFIEAAVRLDEAAPADQAWWALWLMTPGEPAGNTNGAAGQFAYDNNASTGTEVDIFEFVPDAANGYNAAIFKRPAGSGGCVQNGSDNIALRRGDIGEAGRTSNSQRRCFSYQTPEDEPGLGFGPGQVNYLDGNYHRIGMYYDHSRIEMYIDDVLIFETTETQWITDRENLTIRLTWEMQNGGNPWTFLGGNFDNTWRRNGQYPRAYVDFVNVWEKTAVDTSSVEAGDDATVTAVANAVDALESFGATNGTFRVAGAGAHGNGQGWFHYDRSASYPTGVGEKLVADGHASTLQEMQSADYLDSNRTRGDFLIYRCRDRVAVFSRDAGNADPSAADEAWWTANRCSRTPIDRRLASYYKVSDSLAEVTQTARAQAMSRAIAGLESYGDANGTYQVSGGGWRGRGQGWFHYDRAASYPSGVGQVLVDGGHVSALSDIQAPQYTSSQSVTDDFLIYRCRDRVALFSRTTTGAAASAGDRTWWDNNGCNRRPLDVLGITYFQLSDPLD